MQSSLKRIEQALANSSGGSSRGGSSVGGTPRDPSRFPSGEPRPTRRNTYEAVVASGPGGIRATGSESVRATGMSVDASPLDSEIDDEARAALARAEAEAAEQAARRAARARVADHPDGEDFAHMPLPIRGTLANISAWIENAAVHRPFAEFCCCAGNSRMSTVERLFERDPHVGWMQYAKLMG